MCLAPSVLNLRYFGHVRRQIYVAKVVAVEWHATLSFRGAAEGREPGIHTPQR
jgi:hypothetical protein